MTLYTPSLWSQAPEGATHWGILKGANWVSGHFLQKRHGEFFIDFAGGWGWSLEPPSAFTDLHERPSAYQSPAQLIEAYRKEHGAEAEADAQTFLDGLKEDPQTGKDVLQLDHLLYDALFHLTLLEKLLAAERARVEGQS